MMVIVILILPAAMVMIVMMVMTMVKKPYLCDGRLWYCDDCDGDDTVDDGGGDAVMRWLCRRLTDSDGDDNDSGDGDMVIVTGLCC